ncbi:SDR family NAD(P)-dependent oxidoreductase, partial [Salmonella enterica]|uniref:SDR family NAD(P)-dependent oxidoreductase n=1 Tax=Salmonella enterica TaxID=28901 RepID=UPI003CF3CE90
EGSHVFISSRTEASLQETVEEIKKESGNNHVQYVVCDMKDKAQIKQLAEQVGKQSNRIDVLVNNAGGPPAGGFMDMDEEDWY